MLIKLRKIILVSLISSLLNCTPADPDTVIQIPPRIIQADTTDGKQFIAIITDSTSNKNVQLTKKDLAIIDDQIKAAVNAYNIKMKSFWKETIIKDPTTSLSLEDLIIDLKHYKRQYIPSINVKNQKEVWVNCFDSYPDNDDWKSKTILTDDGGKCCFNLMINIEQGRFYSFNVNGLA